MDTSQVKLKALVAEDDRALTDIIRLALARAGFEVSVAYDGQKALQTAQSTKFDVVVSDYQMPLLNGGSVARGDPHFIDIAGGSVDSMFRQILRTVTPNGFVKNSGFQPFSTSRSV